MNGHFRLLVVVSAAIITLSIVCYEAKAQGRAPISPDDDEAAAHLVGPMPVIRMDFARFPDLQVVGAIPVELLVDEQGNVTSAKLENEDDTDAKDLKESQLETLKALVAAAKKTV